MAFKNVFKYKPEMQSEKLKWFFGFPIAWILYILLSLVIPSFGASENAGLLRYAFLELILLACFLLVLKYYIKFPLEFIKSFDKKLHFKDFLISFFAGLLSSSVSTFIWYLFARQNFRFNFDGGLFWSSLAPSFILIIIASSAEEVIYRSYIAFFGTGELPNTAKKQIYRCIISGLLFSIAHFRNPEVEGKTAIYGMVFYFIFGAFLMFLFLKSQGIAVPLGLHIANNVFDAYFCTYDKAIITTGSLFTHFSNINIYLIIFTIINLAIYYFLYVIIFKRRK